MASAAEQLEAECAKNKVSVELEPGGDDLRAVLVREGGENLRRAYVHLDGDTLFFAANIRRRPYYHLSLDLSGDLGETSPFAAKDLQQLHRQLEALRAWRTTLEVAGETVSLVLREVGTLYGPLALCIKVWRILGPMGERHELTKTRKRAQQRRKARTKREPAGVAIEQLIATVTQASAGFAGVVARSGDAIEARLSSAHDDTARLIVGFSTTRRVILRSDVKLIANTPPGELAVSFKRRGFWKKLFGFGAAGVGDPLLDKAFVVDDPEFGRRLLAAHGPALKRLALHGAEVQVTADRVHVRAEELRDEVCVDKVCTAALELWAELITTRRGLR